MSLKLICENFFTKLKPINLKNVVSMSNGIHTSAIASGKINRMKDRTALLRTVVRKDDGTRGEETVDLDSTIKRFAISFPCTEQQSTEAISIEY